VRSTRRTATRALLRSGRGLAACALLLALTALATGCASAPEAGAPEASAPPDDRWEADISAFEATDREDPPAAGGVVFVGSSSIRMWDTLGEDLEGLNVINRGFGGSEMSDALRYLDRIVLPYRPRMVVVYAGDNDLWAGESPEGVASEFRQLVDRIHDELPETRVAFIAVKPSLARWSIADRMERANALVSEYAAEHPLVDYIDVYTPMLGTDGTPRPDLFVDDGLHLNARGYDIWESVVEPVVRRGVAARPVPGGAGVG
jgi:lysophospholipase L1-like esterase